MFIKTTKKYFAVLLAVVMLVAVGCTDSADLTSNAPISDVLVEGSKAEVIVAEPGSLSFLLEAISDMMREDYGELSEEESERLSEKLTEVWSQIQMKIGEFTDEDVLEALNNKRIIDMYMYGFLNCLDDINGGKGVINQEPFVKVILDDTTSAGVRVHLSNHGNITLDDETFEKLILSEMDGTFNVMMMFMFQSPVAALNLSDKIIDDYKSYSNDTISTAIKVKSLYFRDMAKAQSRKDISAEVDEFVKFCIERFNEYQHEIGDFSENFAFKGSIVNSLIDSLSWEAVKAVIGHEKIDGSMKFTCVDRNFRVIQEAIANNSSRENLDYITMMLEIYPSDALFNSVNQMLEKAPELGNERLTALLSREPTSGLAGTSDNYINPPLWDWVEEPGIKPGEYSMGYSSHY